LSLFSTEDPRDLHSFPTRRSSDLGAVLSSAIAAASPLLGEPPSQRWLAPPSQRSRDQLFSVPSDRQVSGINEVRPSSRARRIMNRRTFARASSVLGRTRPTARIAFSRSERFRIGNRPPRSGSGIALPCLASRSRSCWLGAAISSLHRPPERPQSRRAGVPGRCLLPPFT